ncbi:MAG: cell division protein ZapA [Bacteroidales bacterium]|nr:cell division protein ZapA [Bacteroidales bacterium]MBS3773779.1 cell division protein ZapA [Bacteroidales bacterium]
MAEDKLSIRINLADRYYPLKIEAKDEERIRRAAKLINEKILQYRQRYVDKDNQDFLAMAALQFVIKYLEIEEKADNQPIMEDLKELNEELEAYFRNRK